MCVLSPSEVIVRLWETCIFWGVFKMISSSLYVFFFTWGNTNLWAPPAPWRSLTWSLLDRKRSFPSGSAVKNLPVMQDMRVWSLSQEEAMEKGMATNSSILAWRISWTEDLGGLQSIGSQRVRHNWSDLACTQPGRAGILEQTKCLWYLKLTDPVPGCYMTHTVKEWQREAHTEENHCCKVFTFSVQYLISVSS